MTRRIIGVILAIILAVLGTGAVLLYVASAKNTVTDGQTAVRVLVAKQRIPAGTSGSSVRKMTEEIVMPRSSLPEDALQSMPIELDKLVVTSDVQPRQLVLRGMFGQATKLSGGISVTEKLIAVSAKFKAEEEVGGFVRPGSQVTVFATCVVLDPEFKKKYGSDNTVTKVLLPRVEVLAVGAYGDDGQTSAQSADERAKADKAQDKVTLLVTVAVNQGDAEKLIHAIRACDSESTFSTGGLYLALLTDTSEIRPGAGIDNTQLLK
ncbi:pilus assembly protein CpaB [Allocatelliglobosispora scoriae]|uniref:Pilus assembly protein CpaB n=1 Tax=Allocatelliglobosispora scoriae TaxID=643052 RepID=A0A841BVK7_9ACTN|nr:RcpC/CpaB family pilus assembly protein [Allocatelliglobosispora scoriae]MBB5870953.1 pilus assembly protein CpaB [Allocatelliglobosispora scoriae]